LYPPAAARAGYAQCVGRNEGGTLQQAVTEQSADRLSEADGGRLRRLPLIAAAVCVPFVLSQIALAVFVTPIFAAMCAQADVGRLPALWRAVFSLSHGPQLALLIIAVDAAVFAVAYVIARRTTTWVLFAPAVLFALAAGAYVPWLYMPLFQLMDVVR
jgi:hypothetical protein